MHRVLENYITRFVNDFAILDQDIATKFEKFVNYCIVKSRYPDSFDIDSITTPKNDSHSIDGVAVFIQNELVLSADECMEIFSRVKARQHIPVTYIFIQSKTSDSFDSGEMLKFGAGVQRIFDYSIEQAGSDDTLQEMEQIHKIVEDNLMKIENGRPKAELYYVCTGTWNDGNNLSTTIDQIKRNISSTSFLVKLIFIQ